jgi:hypothetical protein
VSVFCPVCGQVGCFDHLPAATRRPVTPPPNVIVQTKALLAKIQATELDLSRRRQIDELQRRIVALEDSGKPDAPVPEPQVPVVLPDVSQRPGASGHPASRGRSRRTR